MMNNLVSKNISTLNSIETLQKKVIESLDLNKYCVGLFVYLKKAFDTVNYSILINKLNYYGIRGKPLDWLISYLNNRQQFVQYNESKSDIYIIFVMVYPKVLFLDHYCFLYLLMI